MKTRILLVVAFAALALSAQAEDWVKMSQYYSKTLAEQMATAKEKVDAPYAWMQCELTLKSYEEAVFQVIGD